jgi:hypothetical protein
VSETPNRPVATGPKPENPYCMRCSRHLGKSFHETNEHNEAASREQLRIEFTEIVGRLSDD